MSNIYDQHRAAFAQVSAYVIMKGSDQVATIAFKFPRDGAGRIYAYVHWIGAPMVRGYASGGGYDKPSAACASAMKAVKIVPDHRVPRNFLEALERDSGHEWRNELRKAGFEVLQAV